MLLSILFALLLVAVNAFFVASEFAITRVRPTQVEEWVRQGRPGAKSVAHAVDRIDAYLAACQLGITVASLGLGVAGERAFHDLFADVIGDDSRVAGVVVAAALGFGAITLLHVVVGELAPKSASIARTERIVLVVAPPMRAFYTVTKPLVDLFNGLGNLLLKPFGIPPAREAGHVPHSEGELRALVRESERSGLIEPEEGAFTDNVFTFGDRRAREVMIPRPSVRFLTTDMGLQEVVGVIRDTGLTRLPLCHAEGELDAAVGLVHAKDVLIDAARGDGLRLEAIARSLERVPESLRIDDLLEQLRARREHLVLVVDEHGTTVGAITLEDVLEEIVGDIEDEFDPDGPDPIVEQDDELRAPGSTPAREVLGRLGLELGEVHETTIGGLLVERLGHLPRAGEELDIEGVVLEATAIGEATVDEVRVRRRASADTA